MAVVSSTIERDQDYNADDSHVERVKLSWHVVVDSNLDGYKTVISQGQSAQPNPIPRVFQAYAYGNEYDEFMLAKKITAKRFANSVKDWRVTVEYDNTIDPGQSDENPLLRKPIDEWDFEQFQRALEKDIDGEAILNGVGEPPDIPLTVDDSRPILTYTRNEANYPSQILTYQDAINSDNFLIFAPKTAKVNIKAAKRWENGVKFYETRYTFHFRYDGWDLDLLMPGRKFRINSGETPIPLPPGEIALLNPDGTLFDPENPQFQTWRLYRPLPFAPLNIVIY